MKAQSTRTYNLHLFLCFLMELYRNVDFHYMYVSPANNHLSDGQIYLVYTQQNSLDCNLDHTRDCHLDHGPDDEPTHMGYSLFNITKSVTIVFIVQSLFDDLESQFTQYLD